MPRYGKWETLNELGKGGQGVVYLSQDTTAFDSMGWADQIKNTVTALSSTMMPEKVPEFAKRLADLVIDYTQRLEPSRVGALKVLHSMGHSADAEKALKRMSQEVETLGKVKHHNLLQILDSDLSGEQKWFVGEYHRLGAMSKHPDLFCGDIVRALKAFRPVVEGVAKLHQANILHRDIKPENVFLAQDGRLVLGDMGLVFFTDGPKSRLSEAYENVGSRDWMPTWAYGRRLDEVHRSFDVFSLGKLFWAMLSGKHILPLWYWKRPEWNIEQLFPKDPKVKHASLIFEKSIVEEEKDCLETASELLEVVDKTLLMVSKEILLHGQQVVSACVACGQGTYRIATDMRGADVRNFGLNPAGAQAFKILSCDHCGHIQLFSFRGGPENPPPAWKGTKQS